MFLGFTIIYKPTGFECLQEFFLPWLLWALSSAAAAAEAIIISLAVIFFMTMIISMVIVAVSVCPFTFAAAFFLAYRWGSSGSANRKEH